MYAIGCSNAVIQIITYPLVSMLLSSKCCRRGGYPPNSPNIHFIRRRLLYRSEEFGDVTNWDVAASILGYAWGMTWLYMALFVPHADRYTFFWVTQDVMGTCMCITFLALIQLNSIQVASILLVVAFVYDIFFVFVTPLIFKESVMITVATSGGPPKADALWCEKYPGDPNCAGGDPLPMLLTIPRLLDYAGGASLLGLGDIVLPGLLLSFAARLDAAKCLVAIASGGKGGENDVASADCGDGVSGDGGGLDDGSPVPEGDGLMLANAPGRLSTSSSSLWCCLWSWMCCGSKDDRTARSGSAWHSMLFGNGGYYFVPLIVAYAVGLLMANVAVYLMQMGQPALLYLVPCTLGTMTYLGWRRQELRTLWEGPKVIAAADEIVYGRRSQHPRGTTPAGGEADVPSDNDAESGAAPDSTSSLPAGEVDDDGETDNVPLLSSSAGNRGNDGGGSNPTDPGGSE
jgi:Signal peptide peptidase